jgi:carboxypeptidase family protein
MRSGSRVVALIVGFLFAVSLLVPAQTATSSLRGTISDPKGAVLPNAAVTLSNPGTGFSRTTKSGGDGVYQFLEVPPATYTLTVTSVGFATVKQDKVTLQVSQPATLNITMNVKGTTEIVEVTGAAPLVNTTDASQGNVFNASQLTSLPAEGRDPVAILSLQPGVTYLGGGTNFNNTKPNLAEDSRGGAVAGARSDQTNVTVDGLDNNDQLQGYAFQGALRTPLDSIQEFRVTTTNSNADSGRSSGAQVNMVTKSGTNSLHGTLYEYNRSGIGQANDWFNENAQVLAGQPNNPGVLHRNTFGAWVGGPIVKNRLFFFGGYEGQRSNEAIQITHVVPSDLMRQGIMQYPCNTSDSNCKPVATGSNANYSVATDPRVGSDQLLVTMSPAGLSNIDQTCATGSGGEPPTCNWTAAGFPYNGGADPYVANIFVNGVGTNPGAIFYNYYPHPNTDAVGDLFDFRGFTFAAPAPIRHDIFLLKLDLKLTQNGNHTLFVKGQQQDFHGDPVGSANGTPQFPGQPPSDVLTNNGKGLSVGYTALFTPTFINNLRYGFVRQGLGDGGLGVTDFNYFRGMAYPTGQGYTASEFTNVPVHNIVDDVSWTKGKHTFQFGGNLRIISNNRTGNESNYSYAYTNVYWLYYAGIAGTGTDLDPGKFAASGYPAVDSSFGTNYDFATAAVAGLLTETNKVYNQDKTGHFFNSGDMITRNFRNHEGEFYLQDAWRVTPNLTLTGGVRYSLLQPPYEIHGNQVAPSVSLNSWFNQRSAAMVQGQTLYSQNGGLIQMSLGGQANGKAPFWAWDYKDIAPRLAFAYSPHAEGGVLHALFGSTGKSSIRGGYGIYYDHFGEGIVNTFDRNGSFGLTTALNNPAGYQFPECTPRMTDLHTLPSATQTYCGQQVVGPQPPALPGLVTPPTLFDPGSFSIYWGLDDKLKTPYSHVFDLAITRELSRNFVFEASYIGRLGHRLLQEEDLAMPLDIVDPASKMDYFTAATMLTKNANAGTDISQVAPIPFWENLFPAAAGQLGFGPPGNPNNLGCAPGHDANATTYTATQAMYDQFSCNAGNETSALFYADLYCLPACAQLPGQSAAQPFNFWDDQFSSLYAWRSIGNSAYHSLQLSLRKAMSSGLQFDLNYTFSKSIDIGSNAERINEFEGFGFASQVINSWSPKQLRGLSDFDMKHQINSNWVYELPVGRGRHLGGNMNRVLDAIVGGWGLSGIFHWTSGLPFTMASGAGWSTNWQLEGAAVETANPGKVGVHRQSDGTVTMWADTSTTGQAFNSFRVPYPGESGQRNNLRGPGYLELDSGLYKSWKVTEAQSLKFAWETFNVTNTPRFDAAQAAYNFGLTFGIFGAYTNTLSVPRVMQFSLRYEF